MRRSSCSDPTLPELPWGHKKNVCDERDGALKNQVLFGACDSCLVRQTLELV